MPKTRPNRAKKRTATFVALGVAPALIAGGLVAGGTGVLDKVGISLTAEAPITLIGHGHGHGRGLGQWGAYGYAKKGWDSERILRHYYGNTTAGKVDNPDVTVSLSEKKSVHVRADAGAKVAGQQVGPGQAVRLSGNTATVTEGCGGAVVKTIPNATFVDPKTPGPDRPDNELLTFCGSNDKYRGSLGLGDGGVINKVSVNDYVRGVIPKESSPAWADAGGMEALKAQAVAARSYVLAGLANGRKIDNTQNSQMYHGAGGEDPRTNTAAKATENVVRMLNGKPALTEFSASTGGYTAGGIFPAVKDDGDDIAPTHDWTATVSPAQVANAFGVGSLKSFEVIEANGLGAENGRVLKIRVTGKNGAVKEATGDQARVKLKLKSDWFAVQGQQTPPKIVKPQVAPSAEGIGGEFLDLGPLTSLLNGTVPDLSSLGLSDLSTLGLNLDSLDLSSLGGDVAPLLDGLMKQGVAAIDAKRVSLDRTPVDDDIERSHGPSANSQGSLGTVDKELDREHEPSANSQGSLGTVDKELDRRDEPSANSQGSTGTVSRDRSDNSQGSLGTVDLVTDLKGNQGLVQVIRNGLIYWSPETGAHVLRGNSLTDFLDQGGLPVLGFPKADGH